MSRADNLINFPSAEPLKCGNCGGTAVATQLEPQQFEYGTAPNIVLLTASVPVRTCGDCGFRYTDEEAETARHDATCRHLGVMTPREVEATRRRLGLSRAELSKISRIGEASLARWENGLLIQNSANDQLLFLLTFPENLCRLRDRTRDGSVRPEGSAQAQRVFRSLRDLEPKRREAATFRLSVVSP